MKFIHCADLHLDSPYKGLRYLPEPILKRIQESTFVSFRKIVTKAIVENVNFIIIAGDLFDGEQRSLRAQSFLQNEFQRLYNHEIAVYIVHGNHDHLQGRWAHLQWPPNVHVFAGGAPSSYDVIDSNGFKLATIHGFSYEQRVITENRLPLFPSKEGDDPHIGILHGSVEGGREHEAYAPFAIQDLFHKQYDYWALGHIHKRSVLHDFPPVVYAGNIQGRNPKETGPKGCEIVEWKHGRMQHTFYRSDDVCWLEETITLTDSLQMPEFIQVCEEVKERCRDQERATFVRFILRGSTSILDETDSLFLEELLENLQEQELDREAFVYPYAIRNETTSPSYEKYLREDSGFISDLLKKGEEMERADFQEVMKELFHQKKARSYLTTFTEEEEKQTIEEAETLLLHFLLKK
ncbi:DNA repair exonuclease [Fictibacillus macauensis ZFHKF-1]|uniref:DNA repair exonuclease n=1 Tax=Fictibacillus macauensis ZFHKF-1 TaxID=1196324 RepID=I8UG37_9BACL|nr:DNA repair exonuclease [Fictibacillus macauensis]EIT85865.1 DNA repair exonuclease [Fictibacillus macauensis ZFHKF-1]